MQSEKAGYVELFAGTFAVGAEVRMLSAFFGEKTSYGEHVIHNIGQYGVSAQLQWCF